MIKLKKRESAPQPIDPVKLKRYVERIEAVELEEAEQKDAKKDIYVEVKAAGMKPKMVKKIVKERKAKAVDAAEEAELERYREALAMPGATYRSVAEKIGMPKSTLHRLVPRAKNGTEPTPHDPATGEFKESDAAPLRSVSQEACPSAPQPAPEGGVGAGTICRECGDAWHGGDCAPVPDTRPRELTPVEIGAVATAQPARVASPDPLAAMEEAEANWMRLKDSPIPQH